MVRDIAVKRVGFAVCGPRRIEIDVRLDGKRALITGGGAGIGRATASAMIDSGARVHVCDINSAVLSSMDIERKLQLTSSLSDVSDPQAVDRLFDTVEKELGGLDILVNNVGISGPLKPIEHLQNDELTRTIRVNLEAQFYCVRRAVPLLKAAGGGSIINVSSIAGRLGYPLRSPYAASKWGVVGLTVSLAQELGPSMIRVNAVCPGAVAGPPINRAVAARAEDQGISKEEMHERYLDQASMHCMAEPADIANLIVFLCSDLGRMISGETIGVDGNTTVLT